MSQYSSRILCGSSSRLYDTQVSSNLRQMDISRLVLIVVLASPASHQVSLTCADAIQGRLKPLANCVFHENVIVCGNVRDTFEYSNITTFEILEQFNASQTDAQYCLGLKYFNRTGGKRHLNLRQDVGFNSSLAVGVVSVYKKCWEKQRSFFCLRDVTMLEEVLELGVIKYNPHMKEFWDFESTLYGITIDWFHSLQIECFVSNFVSSGWINNMQNTNIRYLNVRDMRCGGGRVQFLLKDMPRLWKVNLRRVCIKEFHKDCFTGTPNLQYLGLNFDHLKSIENIFNRLTRLKQVSIRGTYESVLTEDKYLHKLHDLESLHISYVVVKDIVDKFLTLSKLKDLTLVNCGMETLERDAFRNVSLIEKLDLSWNRFTNIHKEAFLSLRNLKSLYLRGNNLVSLPVIYYCSLLTLDLHNNKLTGFTNPSVFGTTIDHLDLSFNQISDWDDVDVFTYYSVDLSRTNIVEHNLNTILYIANNNNTYKTKYRDNENKAMINLSFKKWIKILDLSRNKIRRLTDTMLKSMDSLREVALADNPLNCRDCTIPQFQNWINTTKTKINDFQGIVCYAPYTDKDKHVIEIEIDLETCRIKGLNYWIVAGIPLGIGISIIISISYVYFRFRSKIAYVMLLYRIRKQKSRSINECNFDAFICYSSEDRRFVFTVLVPLLENCPERYKLCLHERDFILGTHIVENIVAAIKNSRNIIVILSQHFINSKFCNWELKMANNKMLDVGQQSLILIQVAPMDRDTIPRHLKFYMDSRTFLPWSQTASRRAMKQMGRQLKKSLGKSIFQSSREQALPSSGAGVV